MNSRHETKKQTAQSLADLFARYLHRRMEDQNDGLALSDPDGHAAPYEAVPVQPVEPRLAWQDALTAMRYFTAEGKVLSFAPPPEWPSLVASQEPSISLAFCAGNYPQMVRNLHPLLAGRDLTALRCPAVRPAAAPAALMEWATTTREYPQILLAAGVLRLARRFDESAELLKSKVGVPEARANEEAALTWHRGDAEEALARWRTQPSSVPVLFNIGMAALFLGRASEARTPLREAVAQLPDTSAWHHLGHLYLALAEG